MPILHALNLSYQFDDGETLFNLISCSLNNKRTALYGRNGAGKSILASILAGVRKPTSGEVSIKGSVDYFEQLPESIDLSGQTIARFLGIEKTLNALDQIDSGSCEPAFFEIVGDQWQLRESFTEVLRQLNLPEVSDLKCSSLSGGQLARLRLWKLFQNEPDILVLDEPSNHLDASSKAWLIKQIQAFNGSILMVSHDRALLNQMNEIWQLNTLGLTRHKLSFDDFLSLKNQHHTALSQQLKSVKQQKKKLQIQIQRNQEKANQRSQQGNKTRKSGSQPKVMLDAMKDKATAHSGSRLKQESRQQEALTSKEKSIQSAFEQIKQQKIYLSSGQHRSAQLISVQAGTLPFVNQKALSFTLTPGSKYHLKGDNGSGKSTLMKVLLGRHKLISGELIVNSPLIYLDQHFAMLNKTGSMLTSLMAFCKSLNETTARTLLAGIGFRRDSVNRTVESLSGGEKMKLAMLIVGQQDNSPVLLLDEPDNHLDFDSKAILAKTLFSFNGAFVLISHDEYFVDMCGVNGGIVLE